MCWEPNQTELSLQLLFIAGVIFSIIGNLCFNLMNLYLSINSSFFVSMLPILILLISKRVIRCSRSPHYGFLNSYQPLRHWWRSTQCFFSQYTMQEEVLRHSYRTAENRFQVRYISIIKSSNPTNIAKRFFLLYWKLSQKISRSIIQMVVTKMTFLSFLNKRRIYDARYLFQSFSMTYKG